MIPCKSLLPLVPTNIPVTILQLNPVHARRLTACPLWWWPMIWMPPQNSSGQGGQEEEARHQRRQVGGRGQDHLQDQRRRGQRRPRSETWVHISHLDSAYIMLCLFLQFCAALKRKYGTCSLYKSTNAGQREKIPTEEALKNKFIVWSSTNAF